MEEIAKRFQEEYTELLSRYKEHLSNAQIMPILQSVTKEQIGFKDNPERFNITKDYNLNETEFTFKLIEQLNKHIDKSKVTIHNSILSCYPNESNAFSGPNPTCSQGPDGCCTTYKNGWGACIGCPMYSG